jgi:hypothetical protein
MLFQLIILLVALSRSGHCESTPATTVPASKIHQTPQWMDVRGLQSAFSIGLFRDRHYGPAIPEVNALLTHLKNLHLNDAENPLQFTNENNLGWKINVTFTHLCFNVTDITVKKVHTLNDPHEVEVESGLRSGIVCINCFFLYCILFLN